MQTVRGTRSKRLVRVVMAGALVLTGLCAVPFTAAPAGAASAVTRHAGGAVSVGTTEADFFAEGLIEVPVSGSGDVYPSTIRVPHNAIVTAVRVGLDLTSARASDLDILLVGPKGHQVTLLSDAGGTDPFELNFYVFSGTATETMAEDEHGSTPLQILPSDYGSGADAFPAPAPPAEGNTDLAVFEGQFAAGEWRLYVVDDDGSPAPDDGPGLVGWELDLDLETAPYPAAVDVSGAGTIADLDVELSDITSTYPTDVDLLLVGPRGQSATIFSDAGGGFLVDDYDVVLDDEAPLQLPEVEPLVEPTYRPANWSDAEDEFPAPAPAQSPLAALSVFDGTDPTGQWRLFAKDDEAGDYTLIGGWALRITWNDVSAPTGTVAVADGAAYTRTTGVTLAVTAGDAAPSSGGLEVRLSNDGNTWSAYQPVAPTLPWTLSATDGTKSVHAQFRDAAGNTSAVVSDSIVLDSTSPTVRLQQPAPKSDGVKPNVKVRLRLTEPLDPATVGKKALVLRHGTTKVKAKVTYAAGKTQLVLTPRRPLTPGRYKVAASSRLTDLAGNQVDGKARAGIQPVRWRFKV